MNVLSTFGGCGCFLSFGELLPALVTHGVVTPRAASGVACASKPRRIKTARKMIATPDRENFGFK